MKHYYAAIFRPKEEPLEGYDLNIPDVEGCLTTGDDVAECMAMAQDALGVMLEGVAEEDYPAPAKLADIDISEYPAGSFVSYVCFDKEAYDESVKQNERAAILNAQNPVRELLDRRHLKIKELSDMLEIPYRTLQDNALGRSQMPRWALKLLVDKVLNS